jgi:hypothetical protein
MKPAYHSRKKAWEDRETVKGDPTTAWKRTGGEKGRGMCMLLGEKVDSFI